MKVQAFYIKPGENFSSVVYSNILWKTIDLLRRKLKSQIVFLWEKENYFKFYYQKCTHIKTVLLIKAIILLSSPTIIEFVSQHRN